MVHDYSANEQKLNKAGAFQPLTHHIAPHLDLILRKKGGFDATLLENWSQIVGEKMGSICMPFKIRRFPSSGEGAATLIVACEGFASVKVQHQCDEIIEKINQFLGFHAVDKIKIMQKSLNHALSEGVQTQPLSPSQTAWLEAQGLMIVDEALRASMIRLGKNIMETKKYR